MQIGAWMPVLVAIAEITMESSTIPKGPYRGIYVKGIFLVVLVMSWQPSGKRQIMSVAQTLARKIECLGPGSCCS